jgi:hypothetical protein
VKKQVLVTGGAGFLGLASVRATARQRACPAEVTSSELAQLIISLFGWRSKLEFRTSGRPPPARRPPSDPILRECTFATAISGNWCRSGHRP